MKNMIHARHSALFHSMGLNAERGTVDFLLKEGIKVIWFGTETDGNELSALYPDFVDCLQLQLFVTSSHVAFVVTDGNIDKDSEEFDIIRQCAKFDSEQYMVEHSHSRHQMVEASAGTGKTSVMIDRVMYLMDTEPGLDPSQIVMITFTNDAANQMSERLQKTILTRYRLTKQQKFLSMLEKQSQMRISTIHSFALDLIKKLGAVAGLTKDVRIKSLKYDINDIIDSRIGSVCNPDAPIESQIGMPIYEARRLIYEYWTSLLQIGLSQKDIASLDWGKVDEGVPSLIQRMLIETITGLDEDYRSLKTENNAVTLNDIIRDLESILESTEDMGSIKIKYLFVDEFQDSDDSQIRVLLKIAKVLDPSLFVVGDVKQSIYRFRGADDSAFAKLYDGLKSIGNGDVGRYQLGQNYRTVPDIIDSLDVLFNSMGKKGMLEYPGKSAPYRSDLSGEARFRLFTEYEQIDEVLSNDLRDSLEDLRQRLEGREAGPSDKVVVLTRSNYELRDVERVCERANIPVVVKRSGSFYTSDAVRDFFSALSSFIFHDPLHLFNYLASPYSSCDSLPDVGALLSLDGDENTLTERLNNILETTTWNRYFTDLQTKPVMSVMMEMIEKEPVVENYISVEKANLMSKGYTEADTLPMVHSKAVQYEADLDKLLDVLQRGLHGDNDLFSLYDFMRVMISTNRDEESADTDDNSGPGCVYCMTVHKAKGLEFDTVFLPFTNKVFRLKNDSEILVSADKRRVGWRHQLTSGQVVRNLNYQTMRFEENDNCRKEEARILYVALTRAIRKLNIYVKLRNKKDTWSELINESGVRFSD